MLQAAGWDRDPHRLCEQVTFTDGRILVAGRTTRRRPGKRADFILRYRPDFPIAVVEAKSDEEPAGAGLQQAKDYAEILGLPFAYATNGLRIREFDYTTGVERDLTSFPAPDDLWRRWHRDAPLSPGAEAKLLQPSYRLRDKPLRYYQDIAINRAVRAILAGKRRNLLTMATGTGKTVVAFQICWKLWSAKWNAAGKPNTKPRILYLADRNFLVDDPKDKIFAPFGDARHKLEGGVAVFSRQMYFATYQSIARDERRPGLYKEFPPDFFDLIIVDECHRGSAKDESNWREILEYFKSAYQLGMTATPLREENRDTYLYFGNPLYTYSLKQGIDDGFLAPYRVHRVITQWDAAGWRPSKDELDRYGRPIPDEEYETPDFEQVVALRARTEAIARHLTEFMRATDRFAKTIVFCVDQEHALEMKTALNNLNADLARQNPDYVCRVTADEGDIGRGHMQRFQDVETATPAILTTSQLLTTGLDAPTCKNVVLVRVVNSMVEFKQIIGRGTRVRDDYGKLWFNILDYTGAATRKFADPEFDGEPALVTELELEEREKTVVREAPDEAGEPAEPPGGRLDEQPERPRRKFYFDGGRVEIATHLVYELDADGKQLRVVKFTDYTAENVRTLAADPESLRAKWTDADGRAELIAQLEQRGIEFATLAQLAGKPDADPFDLLCHLAFRSPLLTRRQRADRVKKKETAFFNYFRPEAREILNDLLEKYAADGEIQFTLPDVLKLPPISQHGNVNEIIGKFGGTEPLRQAVAQLQNFLYHE